ncbi:hypothetical protein GCM10011309_27640 [Litorimonas cladophorae]|uniref:OmpR/PhoB-type domain-containing protein n=1 Tax=Litorimonas cladophorae TaxID=1220491 RepID=A0A918NKP9_9PROT|nr:winged helix-turn-helix domain-containing protein [Litorimonas cladophorae]GGX76035.1 hypothetical protein GCM10011309_27640 [Litorimonas cladophorae]
MNKLFEGFSTGVFDIFPTSNLAMAGDTELALEPLIMRLLFTLVKAEGEVVSRDHLLNRLWDARAGSDEQLTLAISKLRSVLKSADPDTAYIDTIPKRGYRFTQAVTPIAASQPAKDERPSIAVMAFADMSPMAEYEYFGDGMAEEILNALAKVSNLRVAARTSSFSFKGQDQDLRTVGEMLDVTHIIEGSVRVLDRRLRITAQLIRSSDGFHIWSETYDGVLEDVFDLQESIARSILKTLMIKLELTDPRLAPNLTYNETAYDLFLQARSLNARQHGEGVLTAAISILEKAIEKDPDFALAHAELAHSHSLASTYMGTDNKAELVDKATARAEIAAKLDPKLGFPVTLMALGAFTDGDIVGAIDLAEEAYKLEPDHSEVVMRLGYFYSAIGRNKHAIPLLERAVALDPIQGRNHQILALALLANDELDRAEIHAKRAIDLHHYFAYDTYAAISFMRGDYEEAAQRTVSGPIKNMFGDAFDQGGGILPMARMAFGSDPAQRKVMGEMMFTHLYDPTRPPGIPLLQSLLRTGCAEKFFIAMGDRPPPGRHGSLLSMWGGSAPCVEVHTHPKFMDYAEKNGLTKAWRKYGWPDRLL